jgi:hypothetical protein
MDYLLKEELLSMFLPSYALPILKPPNGDTVHDVLVTVQIFHDEDMLVDKTKAVHFPHDLVVLPRSTRCCWVLSRFKFN